MIEALLTRRRLVFVILSLVVVGMGSVAGLRIRIDNSPEIWLPENDPELVRYQEFQERFGSDAFVGLVSGPLATSEPSTVASLRELAAELESMEGVERVSSPVSETPTPMDDVLWSQGGDRVTILAHIDEDVQANDRGALVTAIETSATEHSELGAFTIVGTDVVTRDLDRGSERSFGGLFPLVAFALALIVLLALGSKRMLTGILLSAVGAAVAAVGTLAAAGASLNLLVVLMPAILVVLTVAAGIHVCARYLEFAENAPQETQDERDALWARAWRATIKPSALTTLTTAVGFASLAVSDVGPVRDLGIYTAIGSLWVLVFVFSLVPTFVSLRPVRVRPRRAGRVSGRYIAWVEGRRKPILAASVALTILAIAGASKVRVESNVMEFFDDTHPLPRAYRDFEADFFGLTPFELWLEGDIRDLASSESLELETLDDLDRWFDAQDRRESAPLEALTQVQELKETAIERGLATGAFSPLDRLELLSDTDRTLAIQEALENPPADLESYIWREGDRAAVRVTLTAPTGSSNAAYDAVVALRAERNRLTLPDDVSLRVSGAAPLLVRGQVLLLDTQIRSFATALILITVIVFLAYRSVRFTLLSLVTNVLPILGTLGVMGWFQIPLNAGTVTVAGIALGLVIDDTIHLIYGYARRDMLPPRDRLIATLSSVGRPVLITSVAVALGFGLFAFASFQPTRYFGLLTALTSGFALAADLVLLPALLARRAPAQVGLSAETQYVLEELLQ